MPEFVHQVQTFYAELEPARRRVLWAAVVASVLLIGGVAWWANQTPLTVLTRTTTADEAQSVVRALSGAGIPFELGNDGRTIRVPADREVDARRAASSEDGIVGLEGLEQIDPWVSPFQEQLHRQRMLQGELTRTINALEGIAASTVQLNLPERAAFLRDEARSTAAVTVRPDERSQIDRNRARSIAQLVSHAVAGMTADDVTVVDASTGRLLWSGNATDPDSATGGDMNALAARRESALSDGVRTALTRILGSADAAAVTVHVELETSAIQSTISEIDPESAAPAKERIESEENGNASRAAEGIPGTTANTPERAGGTAAGAASGRKRDTSETTFQYSSTQTTTVRPAGDIRRLSAAVAIDEAAIASVLGPTATEQDKQKLREELESAVRASLGFSAKRNDDVVVSFMAFAPAVLTEETPKSTVSEAVERYGPQGAVLVALLLAYLLVVRPLVQAVRPPSVPISSVTTVAGENAEGAANTPMPGEETDENDIAGRIRRHVERFQTLQPQHVSDLVRRESENSAEVLRRWIRSQQGGAM